jgi:rare lipoprotein A
VDYRDGPAVRISANIKLEWLSKMKMVRKVLFTIAALSLGSMVHMALAETPQPKLTAAVAIQDAARLDSLPPVHPDTTAARPAIDRSGRAQQGRASYYAGYFDDRRMADGRKMNPNANVAASKTLPIGTTAKVVNLDNGRSATVKVEDRGPYVRGRVVDVTPKVADELGMRHKGVVPVVIKPITVPLPDGAVKLGAGAATATPQQLQAAAQETEAVVDRTHSAPVVARARTETASR